MRTSLLVLSLLLCLAWRPFGATPVERVIALSQATRGHLQDERILSKLSSALPDTTSKGGLEGCVARMLGKQVPERHLSVLRAKQAADISDGISRDALFFVRNGEGLYRYVVKAYVERQRFASELSASDLLGHLHLQQARVPALKAIGRAGEYSLLAYEYLPGEPVTTLIHRVGEERLIDRREEALGVAKRAVERIGGALAELHSAKMEITVERAPYFAEREEKILSRFLLALERQPGRLSPKRCEALFRSYQQALASRPSCHTYAHLECHMANWLFDAPSDQLSMIDLQTLHYSIGEGGRPLGSPWIDYLIVYFNLEGAGGLYGLTPSEVAVLQQAFHDSYMGATQVPPPTAEELTFQTLLYWMNIVRIFDQSAATDLPSLALQKRQMADWGLERLAQCLDHLVHDNSDGAGQQDREGEPSAGQHIVGL
ncbi:MAG: phosphotransferase [Parachlamydiales bacterium]